MNKITIITCYIAGCFASFICGTAIAYKIRNKNIENKIVYMSYLSEEIKNRNNKMVNNIAYMYEHSNADKSKLSATDIMLMDMWID